MGWNWAIQAARRGHDVHVVTQHMHREEIEAELARRPVEGLTFHYLTVNDTWDRVKNNWTNYSLVSYYYAWQLKLRGLAKRLHQAERFDLVQHVTYVQDWTPSGLMDIPAPFIWGPVGGSANVLPRSITNADMEWPSYALRFERSRRLMQEGLKRFDPFVRRTMAKADRILIYTRNGVDVVPPKFRSKAFPIVHIGVSDFDIPAAAARPATVDLDRPFQVMTGGRLVHWKGIDLLIEAFARFLREVREAEATGARLLITGKGAYQDHLEAIVERLGIASHVDFLGFLPTRDDLYMTMTACDLFALPTLRDGPPVGILEAMFAGLPVLCLDHGATQELVPDFAGHLVKPMGRAGTVGEIAKALGEAFRDRPALWAKGHKAQAHVSDVHHWDRIGDEAERHYQDVLAASGSPRLTAA